MSKKKEGTFDYLHPSNLFSPKEMVDDTKWIWKWWNKLKGGDHGARLGRYRGGPYRPAPPPPMLDADDPSTWGDSGGINWQNVWNEAKRITQYKDPTRQKYELYKKFKQSPLRHYFGDSGTNIDYDWWEQSQPWNAPPTNFRYFDRGGVSKYSVGSQPMLGAGVAFTNIR